MKLFLPSRSTSIGIATLVLFLSVITVGGALEVSSLRRALRSDVQAAGLARAHAIARVIQTELKGHLRVVEGIARRPALQRVVKRGHWAGVSAHLQDLVEIDPDLASAALFDPRGTMRARVPPDPSVVGRDFSYRDYFRGAVAAPRPYLSEVFDQKGTPSLRVVAFSSALRSRSGQVLGVVQATYPIAELDALVGASRASESGSIDLFDQSRRWIAGDDLGSASSEHQVGVREALRGESGVAELRELPDRQLELAAYAPVPHVGWAVVVERSAEAAYRPVGELIGRLMILLALVSIGGISVTLVVGRVFAQLAGERNRSDAVLASIPEGAVTVDLDARIVRINAALERMAGWTGPEVRGKRLAEVYPLFDARGKPVHDEDRMLIRALNEDLPQTNKGLDVTLETRDGRRIPVAVTAAPLHDEKGKITGAVAIVRDVSHEREVDQLKSSLVSTVSHELRTPLTMIQGFSELLLTRDLDPQNEREALTHINKAADRLSRLVDDLLSVSRIESGKLIVNAAPVAAQDLIEDVVRPFERGNAGRFGIEIEAGMPPLLADRDKTIQVLTNLVSNALKYSTPGSPVTITAQQDGATALISVRDRGMGLSERDLEHLFEKFFRADRREVRDIAGTGLGLYIAKNLVEMQGGQLWVRSGQGEGTVFSFSLPLALAPSSMRTEVAVS